jgi:hypothetical protein
LIVVILTWQARLISWSHTGKFFCTFTSHLNWEENFCHDTMYDVRNNCKIVITLERSSCKHIYHRQCFDSTFEKKFKCKELLTEKWPLCDHSYQRQCFDKEFSSQLKCEVNVQKIFPVCDHEISLDTGVQIHDYTLTFGLQ